MNRHPRFALLLAVLFFISVPVHLLAKPSNSWSVALIDNGQQTQSIGETSGEVVIFEETFDEPSQDWSGLVRPGEDGWTWEYDAMNNHDGLQVPFMQYHWRDFDEPGKPRLTSNIPLVSPYIDVSEYNQVFVSADVDRVNNNTYHLGNNLVVVEVSLDEGASWQQVGASMNNETLGKLFAVGDATQLRIRARHEPQADATDDALLQIDNVKVIGIGDMPAGDGYTYSLEGPFFGIAGQPCEIAARIDPDNTLASICVEYGMFDGSTVVDPQCSDMTALTGEEEGKFVGEIPGDACDAGETVAWRIECTDVGGSVWYEPDGSNTPEDITDDWYAFKMYDGTTKWNEGEIRDGNWWAYSGAWSFAPDVAPPTYLFWPPDEYCQNNPQAWDETPMICTSPGEPYPDGTDGFLTLNFEIQPGPNSLFAWTYMLDTPYGYGGGPDGYNVQINVDDGGWQVATPKMPYDGNVMAFDFYAEPGFYYPQGPTSNGVDLSEYNGSTVQLRFRFADDGSNSGGYDGVSFLKFLLVGAEVPGWCIEGTVIDGDSNPITDAEILVWPVGVDEEITPPTLTTKSDEAGEYSAFPLSTEDHYMRAYSEFFAPQTSTPVTVTFNASVPYGFQMVDEPTVEEFNGVVKDEVLSIGFASDGVYLTGTSFHQTPNQEGSFTFLDVPTGSYDLVIDSDPPGSQGHHTATYPFQSVVPNMTELREYFWPVIRKPEFLTLEDVGSHAVSFGVSDELIADGAVEKQYITEPTTVDVDGVVIPPVLGYRVRLDSERILPDLFPSRKIELDGLENGREYSIEAAVEYGYGDEFLVWSDPITATPNTMITTVTHPEINWVEIRPDSGGSGTMLFLGSYADVANIGGTFNYFGEEYTTIRIYADGVLAFDQSAQINYFWPELGSSTAPNSLLAPYWTDLAPGYNSGEAVWYWYDSSENRFIVQWHAPHYTLEGPMNNVDFEVILDFDDYSITFQYLTTEDGWSTDALIGLENPDGEVALEGDAGELVDGYVIRVASETPVYGTASGHVQDQLGAPVVGAKIGVAGQRPQTWSDSNGDWFITLLDGSYDITVAMPGFATEVIAGVTITAPNDTPLGTQSLGAVDGEVSTTDLELTIPLDVISAQSTSFTVTNTGDGQMMLTAWWTALPNYEIDYAGGGNTVTTVNTPAIEWRGDGVTSRRRPFYAEPAVQAKGPAVTRVSNMEGLLHFNATTAAVPAVEELYGVGFTSTGIHLSDYGPAVSLYSYSGNDPYTYAGSLPFPEGVRMYNGFSLDLPNDCMVSVDSDGRIWRFNSDLTVLEQLGNVGFDAIGCAYNWMSGELYAYTWGDYWTGEPERFVVYNLMTGEMKELTIPQGIGIVTDITFVPNDPDGLYVHALTQYHQDVFIHRYNHRHDFWEQQGEYLHTMPDYMHAACGISSTPFLSLNEPTGKTSLMVAERMDYVTTYQDGGGETYVDAWRGPAVPRWLVIEEPTTALSHGEAGTFTVTVDLSLDPAFTPEPESDTYIEIRPYADYWEDAPVVTLVIHWGPLSGSPEVSQLPGSYALHPAYPNPFNPTATLRYDLPEAARVTITVHNILGQEVVRLLEDEVKPAGSYSATFDGSHFAAGVYFVRFETDSFSKVRKMVLLK